MDYGNRHASEAAAHVGLPNGRMIGGSKTGYGERHPGHLTVFNGTLTDGAGEPLWWGDLDLTRDESALVALAAALGHEVCVLHEGDAWDLGRRPFDPAVAVARITPGGDVSPSPLPYRTFARDEAGRIVRPSA